MLLLQFFVRFEQRALVQLEGLDFLRHFLDLQIQEVQFLGGVVLHHFLDFSLARLLRFFSFSFCSFWGLGLLCRFLLLHGGGGGGGVFGVRLHELAACERGPHLAVGHALAEGLPAVPEGDFAHHSGLLLVAHHLLLQVFVLLFECPVFGLQAFHEQRAPSQLQVLRPKRVHLLLLERVLGLHVVQLAAHGLVARLGVGEVALRLHAAVAQLLGLLLHVDESRVERLLLFALRARLAPALLQVLHRLLEHLRHVAVGRVPPLALLVERRHQIVQRVQRERVLVRDRSGHRVGRAATATATA